MDYASITSKQDPQQEDNAAETSPAQSPEKLPQRIKVFRTMSSTELSNFLAGEQMRPMVEKSQEDLQGITTAGTSAIWFTPDRAEYASSPDQGNDTLVPDDLEKLDFDDVRRRWDLKRGGANDPITNNLMVEFSTDKKPSIAYGNYGDYWVKEYTYPEYDKDDFQVQRVYKLSQREVIFDRMLFHDYESAENALTEAAREELEEEQWMEQNTLAAAEIFKEHASKLPSAYDTTDQGEASRHASNGALGATALAFIKETVPYYEQDPAEIILSGSTECPLPPDAAEKPFENLFIQTMCKGAFADESGTPHFFYPQTFLEATGRSIFRPHVKYDHFAYGLSEIVRAKNSPEHRDDLAIQQAAKVAFDQYLDPDLFKNIIVDQTEPLEIYAKLTDEAKRDPLLNECLINADNKRTIKAQHISAAAKQNAIVGATKRQHPQRPRLWVERHTSIAEIRDDLSRKPGAEATFERMNALEQWREFIEDRFPNADLEETFMTFGSNNKSYTKGNRPWYTDEDTYGIIAFNYAGHRCMIAESCGAGYGSSSAAMKIWRGDANDRDGWREAFTKSKTAAAAEDLCKDIRHTDFTADLSGRGTSDPTRIIEAEDRLFRLAFHYFETGEHLKNNKSDLEKLNRFIGPEFHRPNPAV